MVLIPQVKFVYFFYMLKGYNGNCCQNLLFSLVNVGVKVFFRTLGGFLSVCLNVGGVFVFFPKKKSMKH